MPITNRQYETYLKNKGQYPKNWKSIVAEIRERSGNRCECSGECGLHRTNPGPRRCTERHGKYARWMKKGTKVMLTTAHLCHNPKCARRLHLKHMCQRCHLRYDGELHQRNAARTRRLKKGERVFDFAR